MGAKVTFDTANRLITVTTAPVSGVVTLDVEIDLYSDFKEDMAAPSDLLAANPPPFLNSEGGVPTDDGFTGQYFFLNNAEGWRLQPYDADHELILTGNLQTSDATLPWWVSRSGRTIIVSRKFSNLAQGVSTGGSLTATQVWQNVIEGSMTAEQMMRVLISAMAGKASGLEGTNAKYRDLNDAKDRIDATVDEHGNRSSVTLDGS